MKKILLLLTISLLSGFGFAQTGSWPAPNRPITFINPFPPGGAVDAFGRPLSRQLAKQLNTNIVVENKGGAGGTVGASVAAKMTNLS